MTKYISYSKCADKIKEEPTPTQIILVEQSGRCTNLVQFLIIPLKI